MKKFHLLYLPAGWFIFGQILAHPVTHMQLSKTTLKHLASLDELSNNGLSHRTDLGDLIELSVLYKKNDDLDRLSFIAKLVSKTYGIMKRIGRNGEGYDKVAHEFTVGLEDVRRIVTSLLSSAPPETRQRLTQTYLGMTSEALAHLISLCGDLSWHKNWLIDHSEQQWW